MRLVVSNILNLLVIIYYLVPEIKLSEFGMRIVDFYFRLLLNIMNGSDVLVKVYVVS